MLGLHIILLFHTCYTVTHAPLFHMALTALSGKSDLLLWFLCALKSQKVSMQQIKHWSPGFLLPPVMDLKFLSTTTWCLTKKNIIQPGSQAPVVKNPVLCNVWSLPWQHLSTLPSQK